MFAWRQASSLAALPARAAPADFRKRLRTVNELAAVGLFTADGDFLSQFRQPELFQLFPLLEKPQSFPYHLALRLVHAGVEQLSDETVEHGAKIDVHTETVARINNTCQLLTIRGRSVGGDAEKPGTDRADSEFPAKCARNSC